MSCNKKCKCTDERLSAFDKRLEYNRVILKRLSDYIEANPSMRFNQALTNLNINVSDEMVTHVVAVKDDYYTESKDILARMDGTNEKESD